MGVMREGIILARAFPPPELVGGGTNPTPILKTLQIQDFIASKLSTILNKIWTITVHSTYVR